MLGLKFKMLRRIYAKIEEYKMLSYSSLMRDIKLASCSSPRDNIYYKLRQPKFHDEIVNLLRKNIDGEARRNYIYNMFIIDTPQNLNSFSSFFKKKTMHDLRDMSIPQHTFESYRIEWFLNKYGFISPSYSDYRKRMTKPTEFIRLHSTYINVDINKYQMQASFYPRVRVEFEDFIKIYKQIYKLYAWKKIISWRERLLYRLILIPELPLKMWKRVKRFVKDDTVIKCFLWSIGSMILIILLNVIGYVLKNLNS